MLNRTLITTLLSIICCGFMASGATAAGSSAAVVFSRAIETSKGAEGGLYAARDGRLNQLTEDPTDSEPAFSADGRTIAFVRAGDIWSMRADGSGQRQLTSGPEVDARPLISPNGRYVLFERRAGAGAPRDLYTVRVTGGAPRALTATPADEHEATFSPDGCMIAFVRSVATGGGVSDDLYSVRPAGIDLRRLTHTAGVDEFAPRYFDDDEDIVYSRGQSGAGAGAYADVYVMQSNGRKAHALIAGAGSAHVEDVAPNGRLLLFRRDQGLWTRRLDGSHGGGRKLTQLPDGSATNAVFSSDGRRVAAFVAGKEGETLSAVDVASRRSSELAEGFSLESGATASTIGPLIAWQPVPSSPR